MKQRMKKNCEGCRASCILNSAKCELGYKVKSKLYEGCVAIGGIPQEVCPKPRTYDEYLKTPKKWEIE